MVSLNNNTYSTPNFPHTSDEHLFFKKRGTFEKVAIEDIIYIEADGDYTMTYTANDRYLSTLTLRELEGLLTHRGFFRTHRSYLVNLNIATNIDMVNREVEVSGFRIPYSRRTKKQLIEQLQWA